MYHARKQQYLTTMHPDTTIEWLMHECSKTNSFQELVSIALAELNKFPDGAEIVCGPISTGGRGNVDLNLRIFAASIIALQQQGRPMFSQIPYEGKIFHFRNRWYGEDPANAGRYYMPILNEFYLPIFATGRIKKAWFIPGWESSFGSRWEREQLSRHGAEINDLADQWIDTLTV